MSMIKYPSRCDDSDGDVPSVKSDEVCMELTIKRSLAKKEDHKKKVKI